MGGWQQVDGQQSVEGGNTCMQVKGNVNAHACRSIAELLGAAHTSCMSSTDLSGGAMRRQLGPQSFIGLMILQRGARHVHVGVAFLAGCTAAWVVAVALLGSAATSEVAAHVAVQAGREAAQSAEVKAARPTAHKPVAVSVEAR